MIHKFTLLVIVFLFSCTSVMADTVTLKNRDRISGTVISMEKGRLKVKTSYAGVLSIDWNEVALLDSDAEMTVFSSDYENGTVKSTQLTKISAETGIKPHKVLNINTPPNNCSIKGKVQAGWDKSEGNTRKENINAAFDLTYTIDKNRWKAHGDHYWGASKDSRTDYNWQLNGEYNRFLNEKLYIGGSAGIKQDQFQDLSMRTVLGTGLGYQMFNTDTLNLSVEAGPAYVWEEYTSRSNRDFAAGRWAVDFGWWAFPKHLKLFHTQTGLVSMKNTNNWLWQSKSGVMFPIINNFFASFQYNYDWSNEPVPGKKKEDSRMLFNLGYSFSDLPWL